MDSPHSPELPDFAGLIGGQAVLLHGRPRLTEDIDIKLGADPRALDEMLAACTALDLAPLPADPREFVRETFVLPTAHVTTRRRRLRVRRVGRAVR